MPLDFFKKKDNKSAKTDANLESASKGDSLKKSVQGQDFASQEKALAPEPEKKGGGLKEKLGGLLTSAKAGLANAKENVQEGAKSVEKGINKLIMPEHKAKEYWVIVEGVFKLNLDTFLENYAREFGAFAAREFSGENVDFHVALTRGTMSLDDLYNTFVKAGAPREINIAGKTRAALADLAAKGALTKGAFEDARMENKTTLSDTFSRAVFDDQLKKDIFCRLSGMRKAPDVVGAGY